MNQYRGNQPLSFEKKFLYKERKKGLKCVPEKPKALKNRVFSIFSTGEN